MISRINPNKAPGNQQTGQNKSVYFILFLDADTEVGYGSFTEEVYFGILRNMDTKKPQDKYPGAINKLSKLLIKQLVPRTAIEPVTVGLRALRILSNLFVIY